MANSVTVPTDDTCDLILVSNSVPAKSLAYQETGDSSPVHTYARANASNSSVHLIHGRTTPVGFRTTEGRSDVFQRQLIVAMDTAGFPVSDALIDRAAFDALLSLIEDDTAVTALALCDGHGRRWNVFPEFVSSSFAWEMNAHLAEVKFTEVAGTPVVTAAPLAP